MKIAKRILLQKYNKVSNKQKACIKANQIYHTIFHAATHPWLVQSTDWKGGGLGVVLATPLPQKIFVIWTQQQWKAPTAISQATQGTVDQVNKQIQCSIILSYPP